MEPTTVYTAVSITKEVALDHYEDGEIEPRRCTLSEAINVQAPTLATLVGDLGRKFDLDIDDVSIGDEEDEPVAWFEYDRYEDQDCNEIGKERMGKHERGEIRVWHAVYTFAIEKRTIHPIYPGDFVTAGIRTH